MNNHYQFLFWEICYNNNNKMQDLEKKYDPKLLHKVQQLELSILKDFISVTKKYNINYFLAFGTTLGAVRHKGFIPWDDDIDVCLPRDDFEKFVKVFNKELGDKYTLANPDTISGYSSIVTHLELKGTRFVPADAIKTDYHPGICIDLFILDKVPDNWLKRKLFYSRMKWLDNMFLLASDLEFRAPFSGVMNKIATFGCITIRKTLKLFKRDTKKIYLKHQKLSTKYRNCNYKTYTALEGSDLAENTCFYNEIFPAKTIKYEDIEVNVFQNFDANLKRLYGDYMKMPPKEQRYNHRAAIIDFGAY